MFFFDFYLGHKSHKEKNSYQKFIFHSLILGKKKILDQKLGFNRLRRKLLKRMNFIIMKKKIILLIDL